MSDPAGLIARYLALREAWVDVEPGLRLRVRCPAEAHLPRLRSADLEVYVGCVIGWDGMTTARLLGASLGSDEAVPFDAALWREVGLDHVDWVSQVAERIADMVSQRLAAREATAKN